MERIVIAAADGFPLAATTFGDAVGARAGVLVPSAMGVSQSYYADFARWLAGQGFFVVTFDYRGIGRSRPAAYQASLRGFEADICVWAEDCAAVLDRLIAAVPARPILWIGHSLGAQIYGMVSNRDRVTAMVTVAAGSGYWRQNSWRLRALVWWLWYFAVPISLRVCGYFPGRRLRKVGDLPAGVMRQWRSWCLDREYLLGVEGDAMRRQYAGITIPILSLSFTDDEFMSAANIASLHSFYSAAPRDMRRTSPRRVGLRRVGHFGFFRQRNAERLWPEVSTWLEQHA